MPRSVLLFGFTFKTESLNVLVGSYRCFVVRTENTFLSMPALYFLLKMTITIVKSLFYCKKSGLNQLSPDD